jgi:hypothetical protein
LKIHSYISFLDAESLEPANVQRFRKLSFSLYDSVNKINGIVSRFTNLEELDITTNKDSDLLDLSHLKQLRKFTLRMEPNANQVIQFFSSSLLPEPEQFGNWLLNFNLRSIILPDQGLQNLTIDARQFSIMMDKILANNQLHHRTNNQDHYWFWNVGEFTIKAKMIHLDINIQQMMAHHNSLQMELNNTHSHYRPSVVPGLVCMRKIIEVAEKNNVRRFVQTRCLYREKLSPGSDLSKFRFEFEEEGQTFIDDNQ